MSEHDETDAPEDDVAAELADEDEFWSEVEAIERRKSKLERWKVQDKVVGTESK